METMPIHNNYAGSDACQYGAVLIDLNSESFVLIDCVLAD